MNRAALRDRAMDWLHGSRLGAVGWLVDAAAWLGCRLAGHAGFDEAADLCRHCYADIDTKAVR